MGVTRTGVDVKCGSGTKYRAHVGMVDDPLEYGDASSVGEQVFDLRQLRTTHGAEHAARQPETRKPLENVGRARVDGDISATRHEAGAFPEMRAVHEHGERLHPRVEGASDDLG